METIVTYREALDDILEEYSELCEEEPQARRTARRLHASVLAAACIALGIVLFPFFVTRPGWNTADWALNLLLLAAVLLSIVLQVWNILHDRVAGETLSRLHELFEALRRVQGHKPEGRDTLADSITEDIYDCVIRLEILDRAWNDLPNRYVLGGTLGGVGLLTVLLPYLLCACRWSLLTWLLNLVLLCGGLGMLALVLILTASGVRNRQEAAALFSCFLSVRDDVEDLGK